MILRLVTVLLPCVLALAAGTSRAERAHTAGEFTVHYNVIPTTALNADVARQYGITRSGTRALMNIAVLRQPAGGEAQAVTAGIVAHMRSLIGQRTPIALREVRDQDAIYYIGEFRIRGEENLRFEVDVTPQGGRVIPVRFDHFFIGE